MTDLTPLQVLKMVAANMRENGGVEHNGLKYALIDWHIADLIDDVSGYLVHDVAGEDKCPSCR